MNFKSLDLINGLPAHPLLVHAPVVLVPLTSLLLIALVYIPKLRKNYLNVAVVGALISFGSSKLAESSGEELSERVGLPVEHEKYGERLVSVTLILLILTLVWVFLLRKSDSTKSLTRLIGYAIALVALVAMVVTYQTGHSGAKATWEKRISQEEVVEESTPAPTETSVEVAGITLEEVAKHNSPEDCWSAVNGKVYDLTKWVNQHPGGAGAIREICGRDGTSAFNGQHRGDGAATSTLSNYFVGDLAKQ